MAYNFFYPAPGETIYNNREFKITIDSIVAKAEHLTFVGWRPDAGLDLLALLIGNCQQSTVIEIHQANATVLKNYKLCNVICDDVRNFAERLQPEQMEVLIWQDGPERLKMDDSIATLNEAKKYFGAIIIATPDGIFEQSEIHGNKHERRLSSWHKKDYENLGFTVSSLDQPGFLIGYWTRDESKY